MIRERRSEHNSFALASKVYIRGRCDAVNGEITQTVQRRCSSHLVDGGCNFRLEVMDELPMARTLAT